MRHRAVWLSALLVVSLVGAAAAPAAAQSTDAEGEAYAGSHVQFNTTGNAVSNYAVGDAVVVENVSVQSSEEARSQAGLGLDAGLSAATSIAGSAVESRTEADASVRLGFESGAEMQAHDNDRGIFQVRANDGAQMVQANLSNDAEADSESEERVVVTKEDGSQGTFIVVGDGEVVVNEEGNVTAEVEEGGQLVYRQYDDGERSEDDEQKERMIQNGTATAEMYLQESSETGEEAGAATASVVEYGQDTAVEVESQSREEVNMTVERTQSQGKVVLTSVSESAFENADDIEVFVDGEAAAQADSYSEVEQSAMEGDEPRYYVSQSSSAEATTNVAIGIDHFSERAVSMQSTQDDTATATESDAGTATDSADGSDTETEETSGDGAGFGALAALAALGSALLVARRR
ncbi:MAG: PGF-CTERM sorting domain-containing protein [Natronomonas sp.]